MRSCLTSPILDQINLAVWTQPAIRGERDGNTPSYAHERNICDSTRGRRSERPAKSHYGWRDYAVRVGIWRMIEALDRFNTRASVLLNADCCARYPQIIDAGKKRSWCWLAHGKNNSILQAG